MSEVIKRAEQARRLDEGRPRFWDLEDDYGEGRPRFCRPEDDDYDETQELPDASLIRAYMKDSKGLHVRRTLDQSHYSMLPSTEERDVDQVLLRRGKRAQRHAGKDSLKVVMVDQLWLWMFKDVLVTSFPQTWRQTKNGSKNYDFLTNLVEYIRSHREEPFYSIKDLAVTIVKRCSTIFTTDAKLLFPHPYLLEIYQEAIGDVSAKEATFFRNFNADLEYLSMLYKRVQKRHTGEKEGTEKEFRHFLKQKFRKSCGHEDADSSNSDEPFSFRRTPQRVRRRMMSEKYMAKRRYIRAEMIVDPEGKISALLDSFNNITEETSQLIEIKDVIDELKMIHEVQDEQMKVLSDFAEALNHLMLKEEILKLHMDLNSKDKSQKMSLEQLVKDGKCQLSKIQGEILEVDEIRKQSMEQFLKNGKDQCLEIVTLSEKAKVTLDAINQVLELKQKQANASEARTTRMQAEQGDRQGKTLMVFTIVTIIFLPLSFMTAFFAVPVSDWPKNKDGTSALRLRYVSKFIFPLSVGMILPFLILAFTVNVMRDKVRNSKRKLDYMLMQVQSQWRKKLIILLWISYYVWYPTLRISYFVYRNIWDPFQDGVSAIAEWVKKVVLGLINVLKACVKTLWPKKRKREVNVDDPESQRAGKGVSSSVNDKPVIE